MKKIIIAILLANSASVMAEGTLNSQEQAKQEQQVYFGVLDGQLSLQAVEQVYRNQKEPVCWLVQHAPAVTQLDVVEQFTSPPNGKFIRPNSNKIMVNADATEHQLAFHITTNENGQALQCWQFGLEDPVGLYTETLKINGKEYGPFQFQLVK